MKKESAEQMRQRLRKDFSDLAYKSVVYNWFWQGEYGYYRYWNCK